MFNLMMGELINNIPRILYDLILPARVCFWLKPIFISGIIILTNNKGHRCCDKVYRDKGISYSTYGILPPPRLLYF